MADSANADCMQELAFELSAVEDKHLPWNNELDARGTDLQCLFVWDTNALKTKYVHRKVIPTVLRGDSYSIIHRDRVQGL